MSEKVLLVDDEKDFVEALGERMRVRGMDVSTSVSPKEALKKIEEESYDVVVLDLLMPEMDGIEVLKTIKEKKPEIQIILLTGHGSIEKGVEAMKFGAMDFIEKPADLIILTEKIRKAQAKKMVLVEKQSEKKIREIMHSKGW